MWISKGLMDAFLNIGEAYFLTGVLVTTALFFITIYWGLEKKTSYLLFFLYTLCGAISVISLIRVMPHLFLLTTTGASISLLYFFARFFDKTKSPGVAIMGMIIVLIALYDTEFIGAPPKTVFFLFIWFNYILVLMTCSWVSLLAMRQGKQTGKRLFISTSIIFILIVILVSKRFFLSSLMVSSLVLVLSVTYTVLLDFKERQAMLKSLRVRMVQLENEMLKKSIQPHFLLNTLTVLSEWIETEPKLAVKQIALLSQEFRYIAGVSAKTVVPIGDEIEMCRVHLDIFNAKQNTRFILETRNLIDRSFIPPMIFHTLIENGLTHSNADKGRFCIEQNETAQRTQWIFTSEPLINPTISGEGLGIKYIKSRLEQAFPGKWEFTSRAKENAWETMIGISRWKY